MMMMMMMIYGCVGRCSVGTWYSAACTALHGHTTRSLGENSRCDVIMRLTRWRAADTL